MILDKKYLGKIILPGTVTLVEVASSNAQLMSLISDLEEISPFKYNRESNMDDWIITDNMDKIKC